MRGDTVHGKRPAWRALGLPLQPVPQEFGPSLGQYLYTAFKVCVDLLRQPWVVSGHANSTARILQDLRVVPVLATSGRRRNLNLHVGV